MTRFIWVMLLLLIVPVSSANAAARQPELKPIKAGEALQVASTDYAQNEAMPSRLTCDGADSSPSLRWSPGPHGTESFAILLEDPDAPGGLFVHWILFDIPPTVTNMPKGLPPIRKLANAEKHGTNDFKRLGYAGPCPPRGSEHQYDLHIYAVDRMLNLEPGTTAADIKNALKGHILAQGVLTGKYRR